MSLECPWISVLPFYLSLSLFSSMPYTWTHTPQTKFPPAHSTFWLQYLCIHFILVFHSKVCSTQIANTFLVSFERIGFTSFYISKINIIFCGLENCWVFFNVYTVFSCNSFQWRFFFWFIKISIFINQTTKFQFSLKVCVCFQDELNLQCPVVTEGIKWQRLRNHLNISQRCFLSTRTYGKQLDGLAFYSFLIFYLLSFFQLIAEHFKIFLLAFLE